MLLVSKSSSRIPFESLMRLSRQFEVIDSRLTQLVADHQNVGPRRARARQAVSSAVWVNPHSPFRWRSQAAF